MKPLSISADLTLTHQEGNIHITDIDQKSVQLSFSDKSTFKQFLRSMGISIFSLKKISRINNMLEQVGVGYKILVEDESVAEKLPEEKPNINYLKVILMMI